MPSSDSPASTGQNPSWWPVHPVTSTLAALVAGLVGGIVCDRCLDGSPLPLSLPMLALVVRGPIRRRFGPQAVSAVTCAAVAFSLGWVRHERTVRRIGSDDVRRWTSSERPRLLSLRGHLIAREDRTPQFPQDRPTSQLIVRVRSVGGQEGWRRATGDILVDALTAGLDRFPVGHAVELTGWLERIPEALNPGERSPRVYWHARGVFARVDLRSRGTFVPDSGEEPVRWRVWREQVRQWARRQIRAATPETQAGLVDSIVLGIRDDLASNDREAFRDTSTIHLLAISGLHLQVVALFVLLVARRVGIRPGAAACGVVVITCLYAALVTGGASVSRATVMAVALAASTVRRRPGSFAHRILLAGFIVLAVNPGDLFDPGAQLSFLGTVALIMASRSAARFDPVDGMSGASPFDSIASFLDSPKRHGKNGGESGNQPHPFLRMGALAAGFSQWAVRSFMKASFVSCFVWVVTAPLVAFHFGAVNPVAILANLPLVPITSLALISGLIGLILAPLGLTWLPGLAIAACGSLMRFSVRVLEWSLRHGSGPWTFESPGPLVLIGFFVLAWAFWFAPVPPRLPARVARFGWCVPILFFAATTLIWNVWNRRPPNHLEVEMLAVDHGLAVLMRWPDGTSWLYDCGRMGRPGVGRSIVAPALRARGVHRLHAVFVSHADADHYNGLESMIEAGIRVDHLISSDRFFATDQPDTRALIASLEQRGVHFTIVAADEVLRHDRHGLARVLAPEKGPIGARGSDNAASLVLEVASGGVRLLLTGDLEGDGLRRFADRYASESGSGAFDIVTAPHHGGMSSNPAWFYEALQPRLVLASQARSRFGQRSGLRAHLDEHCPGAALYATSFDGAIRLRWSPEGVRVTSFVAGAGPASHSGDDSTVRPRPKRSDSRAAEMVLNP